MFSEKITKKKIYATIFGFMFITGLSLASSEGISYDIKQLDGQRWQYTYEIKNLDIDEGIQEVTFWFDYSKYYNLAIETSEISHADWQEVLWQPEPRLLDNGGYDILSIAAPLDKGESVSGFTISFDWFSGGTPGPQEYEIVDPDTFALIEPGTTVLIPEPASLGLLLAGIYFLKRSTQT